MESLRHLLDGLFAARPTVAKRLAQHRLWDRWAEVVGAQVAQQTRPARIRDATLVIAVTHPTWMQELSYLKPALLRKIAAAIGDDLITDLRFELGSITRTENT